MFDWIGNEFIRFHPSKEGFKATSRATAPCARSAVSIPQRKVSKGLAAAWTWLWDTMFPSLKGRFQSFTNVTNKVQNFCFHPSKEGFKGRARRPDCLRSGQVSIPQRKVSKKKRPQTSGQSRNVSIPQRKVSKDRYTPTARIEIDGFPSLKGRFQRMDGKAIVAALFASFHPSKEGFKACASAGRSGPPAWFPSLKGRFQSGLPASILPSFASFHPSKEGFKGGDSVVRRHWRIRVSIPQRKVSKFVIPRGDVDAPEFPSLKGRFQSSSGRLEAPQPFGVSIPQRKVSKTLGLCRWGAHRPFPSLKGRFQRRRRGAEEARTDSFHPSKEGFKAAQLLMAHIDRLGFHPSKEGFKGRSCSSMASAQSPVSIPQRKVSKHKVRQNRIPVGYGFHPSKEGFKAYRSRSPLPTSPARGP